MTHSHESHRLSWLEKTVLIHVGALLLFSSWAFGGNIWWARLTLSILGSLALPLCIAAFFQSHGRGRHARRKLGWLIPPALYAGLVFASTYNPSFAPTLIDGSPLLAHKGAARPAWPSTVSAAQSLDTLWFGAGLYLSAFNLAVVIRSRRALHFLLILISANALVLAVFGTLQKLSAAGFYFGAATSPNARFFATFIYYNHWGAFMVLCLATTAGLLFNQARHHHGRDLWQSPFSAALVGFLFIAISGPLSASRAATMMSALLVAVATGHALLRLAAACRLAHRPLWPAAATLLAVVTLTVAAVAWLGFRGINERYHQTQIALEQNQSLWGERLAVYADTAELARRQPVFGWGLNSYDIAFQLVRPRSIAASRSTENHYATTFLYSRNACVSYEDRLHYPLGLILLPALILCAARARLISIRIVVFCCLITGTAWGITSYVYRMAELIHGDNKSANGYSLRTLPHAVEQAIQEVDRSLPSGNHLFASPEPEALLAITLNRTMLLDSTALIQPWKGKVDTLIVIAPTNTQSKPLLAIFNDYPVTGWQTTSIEGWTIWTHPIATNR